MQGYFVSYEIRALNSGNTVGTGFSGFSASGGDGIKQEIFKIQEETKKQSGVEVVLHVVVLTKL